MKAAITPRALQDALTAISEESYEKHQELAAISERRGEAKLKLMELYPEASGKEIEVRYDASADGKREAFLRAYLKGLSHKRTSIISEVKANSGSSW